MRRKLEGKAYVEHYVQSLTHEMKSPLAAIRGASELLTEPLPECDRQHFVASIRAQEQRLTETIDKLLALAEVEQHGWLQTRVRVAVPGVLQAAVDAVLLRAAGAGVLVELDAASMAASDQAVLGDAFLLRQAVINLLENAIAFSPDGGTVQLRTQRRTGRCSCWSKTAAVACPITRSNACSSGSIRWRARRPGNAVPAWACRSCVRWPACTAATCACAIATVAVRSPPCDCPQADLHRNAAHFTFASNSPQTLDTEGAHPDHLPD